MTTWWYLQTCCVVQVSWVFTKESRYHDSMMTCCIVHGSSRQLNCSINSKSSHDNMLLCPWFLKSVELQDKQVKYSPVRAVTMTTWWKLSCAVKTGKFQGEQVSFDMMLKADFEYARWCSPVDNVMHYQRIHKTGFGRDICFCIL